MGAGRPSGMTSAIVPSFSTWLDLAEKVAVEQDRDTACLQRLDQRTDIAPAERIEVRGRLVEYQELRPAEDGLCDAEPLFHSLGELADLPLLLIEAGKGESPRDPSFAFRFVQTQKAREVVEHLARAEELGKVRILGREAKLRTRRRVPRLRPEQGDAPAVGPEKARDHLDHARLA
jgi:hypothetical protein